MLDWNFLTDTIDPTALLLDCRALDQYSRSTLQDACGAAFVKKPLGSGPKSMQSLWGFLNKVFELAKGKSSIISFDEGGGMYASRMTWILQCAGYSNAKMLAVKFPEEVAVPGGGIGQISEDGISTPGRLIGIATIGFVQKNLTRAQLLDVRTPEEYEGLMPRMSKPEMGSICGRIPGSINWDWRLLYNSSGQLKNRRELMADIKRIRLIQERPTIIYDYNGSRACTTALLLSRCGYRQVHVYLGSWIEWRRSSLPKQRVREWSPELYAEA